MTDTLITLGVMVSCLLAGFLLEKGRDVPAAGTVVNYNKTTITVERAPVRVIEEVRVN